MSDIDKLVRNRSRILVLVGVVFTLWQGGDVAVKLLPAQSALLSIANTSVAAGSIMWVIAMLALVLFQFQVRRANAVAVLEDDWSRHIRNKAKQAGFAWTIISIVIAFIIGKFIDLPSDPVLQGLILIGVVSTIFSYVWYEGRVEVK